MSLLERTVAGLRQALRRAAAAQGWELDPAQVLLESPRDPAHGDLASTVALALAGRLGRRPREVAETLQRALQADPPAGVPIAAIEVAGPGF
jgi:arginyl-tRNA synthetase